MAKIYKREYEEEARKQRDPYYGWMTEKEKLPLKKNLIADTPMISVYLFQDGYLSEDETAFCKESIVAQSYKNIQIVNRFNSLDFTGVGGEYILFVHAKGVLHEQALWIFMNRIQELKKKGLDPDILYGDSDELDVSIGMNRDGEEDGGQEREYRHNPWFKPDWSPDTFMSFCYFREAVCVKKALAEEISVKKGGDFDIIFYDFLLKAKERAEVIEHIPSVLYHRWGIDEGELVRERERFPVKDQKKYLDIKEEAIMRRGYGKLFKDIKKDNPKVSIIIPSKDNKNVLLRCLNSLKRYTDYSNYELIVVDNGSQEETAMDLSLLAAQFPFQYICRKMEFNYSKMNEIGVEQSNGQYFLFLNDDIELPENIGRDWLMKLVEQATLPHIGAVGVKLLYPNTKTIQHVGITNLSVGPSHKLATYPDKDSYYFGRNKMTYNVLGVTGACLFLKRDRYERCGGFKEELRVGYGDVDLCVSLLEVGYYNVIRNDIALYHYESLSRGKEGKDEEKHKRLMEERKIFYELHSWLVGKDPFYNENLIQDDITYIPDYVPKWRMRGLFGKVNVKVPELPRQEKKEYFEYTIESVQWVLGVESQSEDHFAISGWSLLTRHDNWEFERYIVLGYNDRKCLVSVFDKLRPDVVEVFPDVRGTDLAGFVCKVTKSQLEETMGELYHFQEKVKIGILAKSKCSKQLYYTGEIHMEEA